MKKTLIVILLTALLLPQTIFAAEPAPQTVQTAQVETTSTAEPMGTSERITGDIFERKGGYVHPFLGVTEYWTDNVFNTHSDKKSDFVTVISPGIYLALPGMKERISPIETLNLAPGGAALTRFNVQYPRRFQTYLLYKADIELYANNGSSLNYTSHLVEGVMQYNMRGGLSIELDDQFSKSRTQRGTGFSFELDKYYANLASASAKYEVSDKTMFRVDYSNYYIHFVAPENAFRNRDDNTVSAYMFYKFWPKTALFAEYDFVDINYDQTVLSGSQEHHGFLGIKWDITDKTKGTAKAGYGLKEFDNSSISEGHNFYAELQLEHKFTPKTTLVLRGSRKTEETDVSQANYIVANTVSATLMHRLTTKISTSLDASYTNEKYKGEVTFEGETKQLNDQFVRAGISAQYEMKDWLKFDAGYVFSDRISNISALSYTNNLVFFRISGIY